MKNFYRQVINILSTGAILFCSCVFFAHANSATTLSPAPAVVVSIRPVYGWVAKVMEGVGEPELLLKGAQSPHSYSLKPSDVALLYKAKAVFWIGPDLEMFLTKTLANLPATGKSVPLENAEGMVLLKPDHHHHHDHDEGHDHDEDHDHDAHHDHEGEDHHHSDLVDPHLWLDPQNAKAAVKQIAATLSEIDPDHAAIYQANATKYIASLDALQAKIAVAIAPIAKKPFVVFHNAYQYYAKRFNINKVVVLTYNPAIGIGAKQKSLVDSQIKEYNISCVFAEPQMSDKAIKLLASDYHIKASVLDPLGSSLPLTSDVYDKMLLNLTSALVSCVGS